MKKIIFAILFSLIAITTVKSQWVDDSFAIGDTSATITCSNAKAIYFIFADSSASGTDSMFIGISRANTVSGTTLKASISLHAMNQTTVTTFVASPIIPGDATTVAYVWYPAYSGFDVDFSGTIFVARLNVNAYAPRTRWSYRIVN